MKNALIILAIFLSLSMTAQEKSVEAKEVTIETLQGLVLQLSERLETLENNPEQIENKNLLTLMAAVKNAQKDDSMVPRFTKTIRETKSLGDKSSISYTVAVKSDNLNHIEDDQVEALQEKLATVLEELKESDALVEVIQRLACRCLSTGVHYLCQLRPDIC